jgi:hypothetical protein
MKVRLNLDAEATEALIKSGLHELRPPDLQAEVLLRRALGLPFPPEPRSSIACTTPTEQELLEPAGTAFKT